VRALVVYESMFGNTRLIAEAIAAGLNVHLPAEVSDVGATPTRLADDVVLLVVGGPTHAFGLSRPATRRSAHDQGAAASIQVGLREWMAALPRADRPVAVASFATRVSKPRVPGSAARAARKALRRLGYRAQLAAEDFWVVGTPGPLLDGEADRARRWGAALAAQVAASAPAGGQPYDDQRPMPRGAG
jgi:hypothetical protein